MKWFDSDFAKIISLIDSIASIFIIVVGILKKWSVKSIVRWVFFAVIIGIGIYFFQPLLRLFFGLANIVWNFVRTYLVTLIINLITLIVVCIVVWKYRRRDVDLKKEKLKMASAILETPLGGSNPVELSYNEQDHFARAIDSLSVGAIRLLRVAYNVAKSRNSDELIRFNEAMMNGEFTKDADFLVGLARELESFNLLAIESLGDNLTHDKVKKGATTQTAPMRYAFKLTSLGEKFFRSLHSRHALERSE